MANKSGTIYGSPASNGNYLYITWEETSYNNTTNQSTVTATAYLYNPYGSHSEGTSCPWYIDIDGTRTSGSIAVWDGTPVKVGTATKTVDHNADGSKTININAYFNTQGTSTGTVTASGTATLTTIARSTAVTQTISAKTETSITVDFQADTTVDYAWYSTNGGSTWIGIWAGNTSSGSYTISGLDHATTYRIRTKVKRKDTQTESTSSILEVKTYSYPYATNCPAFTIGNEAVVTIYNPIARESSVTIKANGTTVYTTTTTGTTVTIPTSISSALYSSIPNAMSGTYTVTVSYNGMTATASGTYSVGTDSAPTITGATYQDRDSTVTAITGNNQKIVQGKSTVRFTASGLSAKNSATISSVKVNVGTEYNMTVSGSTATVSNIVINSSEQRTAVVTITDSRGLTASKTINLDTIEYQVPTVSATAKRNNGFYTATNVNVSSNYTSIGSNTATIQLKGRVVGTSTYTVTQTVTDGANTVNLDNQSPWEIVLTITDSFGGSSTFNLSVGKGIPLFYFDIDKESVSVDKFPEHSNSFEVNGDIYGTDDLFLDVDIYATEGKDYDLTQASIDIGWEDLVGIDTGLIDWRTNESGSIPQNGVPATNSTFNRTLLIEVTPSAEYTFKTDGTAVNSTIRIHGYNSSGTWMRQLTTVSWTGTAKSVTITVPSDIYNLRISYPKLNLYGTGLFEGSI